MSVKKRSKSQKKVKPTSVEKYKLKELQLRYERSYIDQLFENSPEAIVITDTKGHIIRINNEFTHLFGFYVLAHFFATLNIMHFQKIAKNPIFARCS